MGIVVEAMKEAFIPTTPNLNPRNGSNIEKRKRVKK